VFDFVRHAVRSEGQPPFAPRQLARHIGAYTPGNFRDKVTELRELKKKADEEAKKADEEAKKKASA